MNSTHPIRTLRILVENRHGALLKIVGVFTTRAYNIHSLHVTPDQGEELSQMTIATRCDARQCELLCKQLMKIVDVVDVEVEQDPQNEIIGNMNTGGYIDGDRVLRITR
ncbi:MAG TPA: acetolactate synthase small subunit [Terriglobia bacterium]|nr:acetolactate synthase small subunit [Terriglobia bacterium]